MAVDVGPPPTFFGGPADQPTLTDVASAQKTDHDIAFIRRLLERQSEKPSCKDVELQSHEVKTLWHEWKRLAIREDLLCRQWTSADGLHVRWQIVVPRTLRSDVIKFAHTGATGGHLKRKKTEE